MPCSNRAETLDGEQTKEFFDLSARATQHLFEKAQAAATNSFKPTY